MLLPRLSSVHIILLGDGGHASGPGTAQTCRYCRDRRGWLFALDGADERGTHALLKTHLIERVMPSLRRHEVRVVKWTGDGALAEFGSTIDALSAVIELQQEMANVNHDEPEADRVVFRAGVHLGEVIVEDNDLYGDAVNVAARL